MSLYRRVAKAWRSPAPANAVAVAGLSRLVELHRSAAAAIEAAIEHSEPGARDQLGRLHREQTRLADAVGDLVTELGGSPPRAEESEADVPRDARAMGFAADQAELLAFVDEDLDFVDAARRELESCSELPLALRRRLADSEPAEGA